ncbi:protein bfr2 [Oryzias latipes]|uniref:protein bfr2 n=1 Tax=Oryzias latipes TaxID=8090 RepID=UPI0005CBEFB0|nr:protein bfr2 [Oryzias latipes]XP_020564818.1 protein bfr2 [Oryzias latipes]XP_020564819.1 protein bfr2 [Oryzias latipes]
MKTLRQNIWLLVVVGMIFVSVVISLIFIIINICISRRGKQTFVPLQRRSDSKLKSNKYQEINVFQGTPPLPPRTQFLLAEAQSYENLAKGTEDEESLGNYEESVDPPPDFGNRNDGTELYCEPDPKTESGPAADQSYENLSEEHDYEESTDQFDYVKVDDEPETSPLPSQNTSDLKVQSQSGCPTQSYENLSEEHDYEESNDKFDYVKVDDEPETPPPPSQNPSDLKLQSQGSPSHNYDDLNEEPDYEEIDDQLDYVKVDDEPETPPPPSQNTSDLKVQSQSGCPTQSYENLSEEPDYEQSTDDQLDYVKVEDEENPFAHPPDAAAEDSSSEDYDDIGETSDGKEEDEDEDDYDDVA